MIKILIVEDQTMLRDSLVYAIGGQADMEVADVTDDAALAINLCQELKPDMVLMDVVTKNNSNGITVSAQIRKELPAVKIVIMTAMPEITFVDAARKAGVHSFITKDSGNDHLFYVIRSTMQGRGIYPGPADLPPLASKFTEQEIAVIRLVCRGETRGEMMKHLELSESVLGRIITSILDKSGFDNIMKFAVYAVGQGLILPDME